MLCMLCAQNVRCGYVVYDVRMMNMCVVYVGCVYICCL